MHRHARDVNLRSPRRIISAWMAGAFLLACMALAHAQIDPPHVIAQLCFPQRSGGTPPGLPLDEVGRGSISSVQAIEAGITTDDQRVVEIVLSEPGYARHLILSLNLSPATVFIIPARFVSGEWSAWRAADFQSAHPELQFLLLSEQRVPDRSTVPDTAPRIRFHVMTYERYLERDRARRERGAPRDLPAC
jgi:hypothetical protein